MTTKKLVSSNAKKKPQISHPGLMGDGTEEQNLNEPGDPLARIGRKEVQAAFGKQPKQRAK